MRGFAILISDFGRNGPTCGPVFSISPWWHDEQQQSVDHELRLRGEVEREGCAEEIAHAREGHRHKRERQTERHQAQHERLAEVLPQQRPGPR